MPTTQHNDPFFTQQLCSRCNNKLKVRIMSWFNQDVICTDCSIKESKIKKKLREQGITNAMEGCGHIPTV
jgi:hypothetical protein